MFDSKGCLKIMQNKPTRTYDNAKLYFQFRDSGIPEARAIAMANRSHCDQENDARKNEFKEKRKEKMEQELCNRMHETILKAKREELTKIYSNYVNLYKNQRDDIVDKASEIYTKEMSSINLALSAPISPKVKLEEKSISFPTNFDKRRSLLVPRRGKALPKKNLKIFLEEQKLIIAKARKELEEQLNAKLNNATKNKEKMIEKAKLKLSKNHVRSLLL